MNFRTQLTPNRKHSVHPGGILCLTNALKLSGNKAKVTFTVDGQTFDLVDVVANKVEYKLTMNIGQADVIVFESHGDAHVSIYGHIKTQYHMNTCDTNFNMDYQMDKVKALGQLDDEHIYFISHASGLPCGEYIGS